MFVRVYWKKYLSVWMVVYTLLQWFTILYQTWPVYYLRQHTLLIHDLILTTMFRRNQLINHFASEENHNSLWPNGVIWRRKPLSATGHVMACRSVNTKLYWDQCWLNIDWTFGDQFRKYWESVQNIVCSMVRNFLFIQPSGGKLCYIISNYNIEQAQATKCVFVQQSHKRIVQRKQDSKIQIDSIRTWK